MNSDGTPPLLLPLAISILLHASALPFAIFDDNLPNKKQNEQLINITLEPTEQRDDLSTKPIEPISRIRSSGPLVRNETIPNDIVVPKIEELSKLSNIHEQKPPVPYTKPIAEILPQLMQTPSEPESNIDLTTPDRLHESSRQQVLESLSTVDQELSQVAPPPPKPLKNLLPKVLNKDQRKPEEIEPISTVDQELTQVAPLPPRLPKTLIPEVRNKDQRSTETIDPIEQPPIVQSVPPEINKPLPQQTTVVEETVEEETEPNAFTPLNNSAAKEYAAILHKTLNKRVKRKYPRKAIQNCIEGTVKVQIQISPSGEQLTYEILNANEAPSILRKATEKLLSRNEGFSSFNENLSDQPMTFKVNLVYRLPQCAN